jgi:hypothetical protein
MSTDLQAEWQPNFYVDGQLGEFGNTYRQILQLEVGDYIDLAKVIAGAANIKTAVIWRTKDGWELRGTTYSGGYGLSIEPEDLSEDKSYFDKILVSLDAEPPYKDADKCECGCGAPTSQNFIKKHDLRLKYMLVSASAQGDPNADIELQRYGWSESADAQPAQTETAQEEVQQPDADNGEEVDQPVDATERTDSPDAPPESNAEPEQPTTSNPYTEFVVDEVFGEEENPDEAEESSDAAALSRDDLYENLDSLVFGEDALFSMSPIDNSIELIGIVDPYVEEMPFENNEVCACGCGSPIQSGNYVEDHDIRHKVLLLEKARLGNARAYDLLTKKDLSFVQQQTSYNQNRVPSGLPISRDKYRNYKILDPGDGTLDEQIGVLINRRDETGSVVDKLLLNEAIYRLRNKRKSSSRIRPSDNTRLVAEWAFRFAVAASGELLQENPFNLHGYVKWSEINVNNKQRLKNLWQSRKNTYIDMAIRFLDEGDPDMTAFEVAVRKQSDIIKLAIRNKMMPSEYIGYGIVFQYENGNPSYSIENLKRGEDSEYRAPVTTKSYIKYKDLTEFNGDYLDVRSNFYNHVILDMYDSKLPFKYDTDDTSDVFIDAINFVKSVINGDYDNNRQFLNYFSDWWIGHGYKSSGYWVNSEQVLLAKNAQDYTRTKTLGLDNSKFGAVKMVRQKLSEIDIKIGNDSKSVFMANSPLHDGHFDAYTKAGVPHAMAVIGKDHRSEFFVRLLDFGAEIVDGLAILEHEDFKVIHAPDSSLNTKEINKQMYAYQWLSNNIGDGPFYWLVVNDLKRVSVVVNKSGDVVWVSGNASEGLLSKLRKAGHSFIYKSDTFVRYANLMSDHGYLAFKKSEDEASPDQSVFQKLEDLGLNFEKTTRMVLDRNDRLMGIDKPMQLITFYNLYLNNFKSELPEFKDIPESGTVEFINMKPSQIVKWFVQGFNSRFESSVPQGHLNSGFVFKSSPVVFQDEFADGSVKPLLKNQGLTRRFGLNSSDLAEVTEQGSIRSGKDGLAYATFGDASSPDYFPKYKYTFVFMTEIVFSDNARIATSKFSPSKQSQRAIYSVSEIRGLEEAEVAFPYEIKLENAHALIVAPGGEGRAVEEFADKYPHVRIVHASGSSRQIQNATARVVAEYNTTKNLNYEGSLLSRLVTNNNSAFSRGLKSGDFGVVSVDYNNKSWLLPVEFVSVTDTPNPSSDNLQVQIVSTPMISDLTKNSKDFSEAVAGLKFREGGVFQTKSIDVDTIVWLSPRMNL